MVAYLTKSDASEGFNQVIDFSNRSYIKYSLTVNPNIYVSCIKQFWNTVAIKQVNDVTRLQALVDKKKVVVTEAALESSSMASAIICLSTGRKFNFSKYIFDSLVRNVDITTKFYMYPHFLQVLIRKQVGDLLTHTTKYTSPALTQKIKDEGDADKHVKDVTAGDDAQGDDTAVHGADPTVEEDQGRIIHEMDKDDAVVLMDEKEEDKKVEEAKVDEITTASAIISTAEPQVSAATITAAPSRRRKGVVIRDPEEESTTSSIIPAEIKSKDKGKGILVEEPKPLKKKQQIEMHEEYARKLHAELNKDIDWDVAIDHVKLKAKEDPAVKRYQVMKRAKNKSSSSKEHDDTKEQMEEEESRVLQRINETPAERAV
nr:hypothetical protein [Tanacetum cinerariifolium]